MERDGNIWWDVVKAISKAISAFSDELKEVAVFLEPEIQVVLNPSSLEHAPNIFIGTASKLPDLPASSMLASLKNTYTLEFIQTGSDFSSDVPNLAHYLPYAFLPIGPSGNNAPWRFLTLLNHWMERLLP